MEAVKQGAATVGICSKTHVVLAALKVYELYYPLSNMLLEVWW